MNISETKYGVEKAHLMKSDEDCMGHTVPAHWRSFALCSNGEYLIGLGSTAEEAELNAQLELDKKEKELLLPPKERLKLLLGGPLYDADLKESVRLIGKLLLT